MVYGNSWQAWNLEWPIGYGIVNGIAWRDRDGIWFGLASMTWHMIWTCGHGMVYAVA